MLDSLHLGQAQAGRQAGAGRDSVKYIRIVSLETLCVQYHHHVNRMFRLQARCVQYRHHVYRMFRLDTLCAQYHISSKIG